MVLDLPMLVDFAFPVLQVFQISFRLASSGMAGDF